jgi:predicted protein tyrosine phosphatase
MYFLMETIKILSMRDAVTFRPKQDTLMIRIFNTLSGGNNPHLEHEDYFRQIFEYYFDDILPKDVGFGGELFSDEDAREIIGDFNSIKSNINHLVVHCYAGVSRSSAVAASLNHIFDLGISENEYLSPYRHFPNMYIYNTMVSNAQEMGFNFKIDKSGERYF